MNKHLLDTVMRLQGMRDDAKLSNAIGSHPPYISKVRAEKIPVGATLMIKIHEATDMPIAEIKRLIALGR
jgi:hypothetical protein